ncbi:hypothetical protein [Rhizobium sp. CECT 9324]|nr:hypothetical protein [Rhizobium sp. CECT 9324]
MDFRELTAILPLAAAILEKPECGWMFSIKTGWTGCVTVEKTK